MKYVIEENKVKKLIKHYFFVFDVHDSVSLSMKNDIITCRMVSLLSIGDSGAMSPKPTVKCVIVV